MNSEPDLTCPKCGNTMELMTADEAGSLIRVCPVCATLAWNGKDGTVEIRQPQKITGEAKRQLLEKSKFDRGGGIRAAQALKEYRTSRERMRSKTTR